MKRIYINQSANYEEILEMVNEIAAGEAKCHLFQDFEHSTKLPSIIQTMETMPTLIIDCDNEETFNLLKLTIPHINWEKTK